MNTKEKIYYYEVMRIIACIFVIMNHTAYVFERYVEMGNIMWMSSNFLFFMSKTAVPIFIMITGSLILKKEEGYESIFRNRLLKLLITIIIWTIIYECVLLNKIVNIEEIMNALKNALKSPIYLHFWYLYMLIGLYIMTPFIKKMIKQFEDKDYIIFLSIWFIVTSLIPFLNTMYPVEIPKYMDLSIFSGYIGIYILGYYLDNKKIDNNKFKIATIIFFISIILSVIITWDYSRKTGYTWNLLDNVIMAPIVMSSAALFIIIKYLCSKYSVHIQKINKVIIDISSSTFGIYIVHMIVISKIYTTPLKGLLLINNRNPLIGSLILDLIVFLISYLIVKVLKLIPILKKHV